MMKNIILLLLLLVNTSCAAHATEQYTRVGVMIGGTGGVSLTVERHIGDLSGRIDFGIKGFLFNIAASVNKYASVKDFHPYVGIGILNLHAIFNGKVIAQYINAPIGLDYRYGEGKAIGAEVDFIYFVEQWNSSINPLSKDYNRLKLSPGIYYREQRH